MAQQKIRVALFGESRARIDSFRTMLRKEGDITCSGATTIFNGTNQPEVLILEWDDATEGNLKRFCISLPKTKLIVMDADKNGVDVARCIRYGVSGFVSTTATWTEIANTIRKVSRGGVFLEPVALRLTAQLREEQSTNCRFVFDKDQLTSRERAVAQFIADGLSNQEIADKLSVSLATVKSHVQHVFHKVHCRNRAQLISLFLQHRNIDNINQAHIGAYDNGTGLNPKV